MKSNKFMFVYPPQTFLVFDCGAFNKHPMERGSVGGWRSHEKANKVLKPKKACKQNINFSLFDSLPLSFEQAPFNFLLKRIFSPFQSYVEIFYSML